MKPRCALLAPLIVALFVVLLVRVPASRSQTTRKDTITTPSIVTDSMTAADVGEFQKRARELENPKCNGGYRYLDHPARVSELTAAGRPVFVDFTAAWCVTCQVNKHTTLNRDDIRAAFAERSVALLRADWTRRDPAITAALRTSSSGFAASAAILQQKVPPPCATAQRPTRFAAIP